MTASAWGLDSDRTPDWRHRAACGPATAHLFEPGLGGGLTADNVVALRICARCPVRQQCFDFELASDDEEPRVAGGYRWKDGRPVRLAPCGTEAAAARHRRHGDRVDMACAEAVRSARAATASARRARSKVDSEAAA